MPSTAGTSCTSSITTKNSSPPSRATKSLARRTVRSRRATSISSPSPISWPCASLICLKPSRSMNTPASLAPRRREAGAVGQAGQRIAVGERGDALARQRDLGDIAPDAAVAEEGALRAKARLAADREVADAAVRPGAPELEIAERRSRLEHAAQLAPAGLAGTGDGIDVGRALPNLREAVLRVGFPEEVRRHLHQAAEAQLALALRFLRLLSLEELADLAADDARGLHQALVGLAHRLARERENADDAALGDDRERKAAVQAAAFPQRLMLHARVVHGVLRPDRLAALPDLARQAFARTQGDRPRTLDELLHHRIGHAPRVLKAQQAVRLVEPEIAAASPALDLAHGTDHRTHDFVRLVLPGERMRDLVLQAQHLLGALVRRDVAADAAIALEAAAVVEYRLAAQREPDAVAVAGGALDLEITERLAALELGAVPLPVRFGQVERRLLVADIARHVGEAEFGVQLPVPVRGKLRQAAKAGRACAQHAFSRARAHGAAGRFGPATANCFRWAGCAPAASCHRSLFPVREFTGAPTPRPALAHPV